MPGYTACTACPAHAAQASHSSPHFNQFSTNSQICASHPTTPWKQNSCSQQPGMPGYIACTACPAHAAQPVLHQLPNLHLAPHQTLEAEHLQLAARLAGLYQTSEAEHLQLAARHARLYSLHSLSSPRSPDQSQFPTCQAVRQLPNLHLKPHQTLEAEHLQLAARHARLYSLQVPDMSSSAPTPKFAPQTSPDLGSRTPAASSQACQAIQPAQPVQPTQPRPVTVPHISTSSPPTPKLRLAPHHTLEAEHLQPAARHARLYSLHSLSSPRSPASAPPTPKFAPQTSPDLGSRTRAASSEACQAIQLAQPVQPTQPRPVTVLDMSSSAPTPKFAPQTSPDLG